MSIQGQLQKTALNEQHKLKEEAKTLCIILEEKSNVGKLDEWEKFQILLGLKEPPPPPKVKEKTVEETEEEADEQEEEEQEKPAKKSKAEAKPKAEDKPKSVSEKLKAATHKSGKTKTRRN